MTGDGIFKILLWALGAVVGLWFGGMVFLGGLVFCIGIMSVSIPAAIICIILWIVGTLFAIRFVLRKIFG